MPCSYMPADTRRTVAPLPSRAEAGLPDGAFVFCSFNSSYKFNPPVFDLWCRLLRECPDSVLWLSKPGAVAQENLLREAGAHGIDPARILFAPRVEDYAGHLARLALADLALDTFPYNSHSTGVDTLWAGVPMVTCLGDIFPARVGASLLHAAGLAELVAPSPEAYLATALRLYRDPALLGDVRRRLAEGRDQVPLFDMERFVGDLERLYSRMWDNFSTGRHEAILSEPVPPQP
jgi:predicted O-linked N-acetylglucosamine transferase (SPINDLY family)